MAPFNLEKNIREKLENRELNPSSDTWKKLEIQLDKKQPRKKTVSWYYLAASVVTVLIMTSVFLNRNTTEVENKVVIENVLQKNDIEMKSEIVSNLPNPSTEENSSEEIKTEQRPKQTTKELKQLPSQKESTVDKKIRKSEMLADISKEENSVDTEKSYGNPIKEEERTINAKVDEVVASVKSLQERNEQVTEAEVEDLLANARRDIQTQRILSNPKVDATVLLNDVEWELEKSFRDKVFDALGEGFNRIRTAVSERNN